MDITAAMRRDASLKAIEEAKAVVANLQWDHEPVQALQFLEGAKPAPLEARN